MMHHLRRRIIRRAWWGPAARRTPATAVAGPGGGNDHGNGMALQRAVRSLGVPATSHLFSDPAVIPKERRAAMVLSARLQVELMPEEMDTVCQLLEKRFDTNDTNETNETNELYAGDFRTLLFKMATRLGWGTELCSLFIQFVNAKSPVVCNIFNYAGGRRYDRRASIKAAFDWAATGEFSDMPRLPDSADTRTFVNFVMVGLNRIVALNGGAPAFSDKLNGNDNNDTDAVNAATTDNSQKTDDGIKIMYKENGKRGWLSLVEDRATLLAMRRALQYAGSLVHKDRKQAPLFQINDDSNEDAAHMREISELCMMCFLHMRKITPEESFRVFMDTLVESNWDDHAFLSGLSEVELAARFHRSLTTLKESKEALHIAPQTQMPEDHDMPSDFLDFILAHQTEPLSSTSVVPSLSSSSSSSSSSFSSSSPSSSLAFSGDIIEHIRDALVSKIALEHGETPNRIAVGNMWSDPNCVSIGEETLVDTLLQIRSLANPVVSLSKASHDFPCETEEEKMARIRQRRMERMERLWGDRVQTDFDRSTGVFSYPESMEGESSRTVFDLLDPLERLQHNMLMRRTARLLSPRNHTILVKHLHALLSIKTPRVGAISVDSFYSAMVGAFGPHYAVVEPLFEALLPHVCIVSLSTCKEKMGRHLSSEPRLVALGETNTTLTPTAATGAAAYNKNNKSNDRRNRTLSEQRAALEDAFQNFVACQAGLEPRIQSRHIKRPALRSIPPAWWERVCHTMMDSTTVGGVGGDEHGKGAYGEDTGMHQAEIDDIVRAALKSEQDARNSVDYLEVDADGKVSTEMVDDHIYSAEIAQDSLAERRVMLLGLPPYVTAKNIIDALPNDPSAIEKVEIFGDNFKNTMNTIKRSLTDMQVSRSTIKAMRVKSVDVRGSQAFAIITLSSAEEQQKAHHRYMETFGAKVHAKFFKHVKKDPNNSVLKRQLKRLMGTEQRRRVVYDPETGKPKRKEIGNPPKILTRPVYGVGGSPIHDPIIPNKLAARCRVVGVSRMNTLFIKGLQTGLSGYQIAEQLSDILQSAGVPTGPIADINPAGIGSITNMGKCHIKFPNHTMAQKAKDAIATRARAGTTQLSATWFQPRRQPGEIETDMAKKVWKTIREIKAEQIDQEEVEVEGEEEEEDECGGDDDDGEEEEKLSGLEKAILNARATALG
jgi:hypothetical protein